VLTVVVTAPRYKMTKFRDWLLSGVSLDIKPNVFGFEVLSYLAYETVAQVQHTFCEFLTYLMVILVLGVALSLHLSVLLTARVLASQAEAIVRTGKTWPQATKQRNATKRRN